MPKLSERTQENEGGLLEQTGHSPGHSPEEEARTNGQAGGAASELSTSPLSHSQVGGSKPSEDTSPTSHHAGAGGSGGLKGKALSGAANLVPETKDKGAVEKKVDKAAGELTKAALTDTGAGAIIAKPAGDVVEKVGVTKFLKAAGIILLIPVSVVVFIVMIGAYVVTHPWEAAKKVLFDSSYRRFALSIAEQTGGSAIKVAFRGLSYETDYKPGQAIAAPNGTRPEPGTLLDKISKVDFQKSKYKYKEVDCPYDVVTKPVVAFDGQTRSVIDKVVDSQGREADMTQPVVLSCIMAHYPLTEAMLRSPEVRKVNQAANVHLNYAEPKGSTNISGKSQDEVKAYLHKKTLERVWKNNGESTDCDKNFKAADNSIDTAIKKAKNDLLCGVKPEDITLSTKLPSDKNIRDTGATGDASRQAMALTLCAFNDKLVVDDKAYDQQQTSRTNSSMRAGIQAPTLADTGLGGDISTSELNSDFYKISNFAVTRSYNYAVNGNSTGKNIDPQALASTLIGLFRTQAKDTGVFNLQELCALRARIQTSGPLAELKDVANGGNTKQEQLNGNALNLVNVYTIIKGQIKEGSNGFFPTIDDLDIEDVLIRTIKIVDNISNAGTEDGPDNFNNMTQGIKAAAYNQLLGASGGHYQTPEEAAKSSAMVEGIKRFNEQHNGIAYRLFGRDNVRSLASQLTSQFTARPGQVGQKAIAAAIDMINPIKAGAQINDAIAYYGFGENNRALAASDDDRDYYRLTTVGTDDGIDMLSNAAYIEGLKKTNNPGVIKAFAKWDECSQMYWASAELLDNDPNAYNPKNSATKDTTERYCQVIRRSPASVNIPENFGGEKGLAKSYANYLGNMNLFTAWDRLSSDTQDDSIYANGSTGGATGGATTPGPTIAGLTYPPNLAGAINGTGYYRMPDAQPAGLYVFSGGTPENSRCGSKELTAVIYTVAQQWKKTYPDSTLRVGDLNAPGGHLSHKKGVDVDITTSNQSAANVNGDAARSIQLGKWFIDTGIVQLIYFDDTAVQQAVTAYARQVNKPGVMKFWPGHYDHFHVRILDTYLQPVSMGCPS